MTKTILYVIKKERFFDKICNLVKVHIKNKKGIYLTTHKPYSDLIESFNKKKIDCKNILFIDCISKLSSKHDVKEADNCILLESPYSITNMALAIDRSLKLLKGEKIVFIDSLGTLLFYNDKYVIGRFINFLHNKLKMSNNSLVIFTIHSDNSEVIDIISSMVDEVKEI